MKATDLKTRSEALSYEDAMKNDITDADFVYLNASTANVKALKQEALNAIDLYNAAYQRFLEAEAVYTDAKKVNAAAIAELANAQAEYDAEHVGEWKHNQYGYWYEYRNGTYPVSEWKYIDGEWYWFNSNGYMARGWEYISGHWYRMNSSGAMETGWRNIGGSWYYLNDDGAMATGWKSVNNQWYYLDGEGIMKTDWQYINGKWYYLYSDGSMATGWKQVGDKWYYMNGSGEMQANKWISGIYYVKGNGEMATSEWVDGYYVDGNGVWVK